MHEPLYIGLQLYICAYLFASHKGFDGCHTAYTDLLTLGNRFPYLDDGSQRSYTAIVDRTTL